MTHVGNDILQVLSRFKKHPSYKRQAISLLNHIFLIYKQAVFGLSRAHPQLPYGHINCFNANTLYQIPKRSQNMQ
jgi:hypothetical protein